MHVLILVMSARKPPYGSLMDAQKETWDAEEHPQTLTTYYVGGGIPEASKQEHNVIYSNLSEDLLDVSWRTLQAFEESLVFDWDYMARPHSSTYVHKRNLVAYCETLPKENVMCGVLTEGTKPFLWGGCHYIFSRDVIEKIVANKDKWNNNLMEDSSITEMVNELGIPITGGHSASINVQPDGSYYVFVYGHGDNFTFTDWSDINKAKGHFFFRVKHDPDRSVDIQLMRKLKEHFQ